MAIADLEPEVRSPSVRILSEPLTYDARLVRSHGGLRAVSNGRPRSYIHDFVMAETRGDSGARARLRQHEREMRIIGDERRSIFSPDVAYDFEQRAVNWTAGTGGYFAPPLWLIEYFAVVPTAERVLASRAPQFELPAGAQSVNLPRWTAGADMGAVGVGQATPSTDLTDSAVSSAVVTIAGNADVPMQMLEQSPVGAHLDWAVFTNMEARYGYKLEQQLITGTGATVPQGSGNNQLLGILNNTAIPATNTVTYTDASPTVAKMLQTSGQGGPLPQAVAAIGNNRKIKPELWLMTTSRSAWINSGEVAVFPLAVSDQVGPGAFDLLAYPVEQDDAIPVTLGAGLNQDVIICCRPSDWLILESERRTQVMVDVLSGTLQARLQMRRYVAALLRQPTSVAYVQGTGLAVATNF